MTKSTIKNTPNPTSSGSGEGKPDLVSRQAAIDALDKRFADVPMELTTEILQLRRDLRERIPSAQPATNYSEIPNGSDDTISRQAAIDVLHGYFDGMLETDTWSPCDVYGLIEILPAVQPDHVADIGKKVEAEDCISRRAALDTIMGQPPEPHYPSWYAAQIEELPAAQPEIIHCKDCKYWTHIKRTDRYWCKTDDGLYDLNPSPDDFCSRAERRTE